MNKPSSQPPTQALAGPARGGRRRVQRQRQLSFQKAVQIAWRNIRQRIGRSLLVTIGIILALAFLTYILYSDAINRAVLRGGSSALLDSLTRRGMNVMSSDADARIQTRWMLGLALLVSFVGILNSMLLSVTERFKEIGTMKCLGALDSLIVKLFLLESTFQGLVGTTLGIIIGVALALSEGIRMYGTEMWGLLPMGDLVRLLGLCILVGVGLTVTAALYPAWRAAKMEPVEAMRSEV